MPLFPTWECVDVDDGVMAGSLLDNNVDAEQSHVESESQHRDDAAQQLPSDGRTNHVLLILIENAQPRGGIRFRNIMTIKKYCWSLCECQQFC